MKYFSAFLKGPAYAEMLKSKMENVESASQAMNERASQREQVRLKEIRNVTVHSMFVPLSTPKLTADMLNQPKTR